MSVSSSATNNDKPVIPPIEEDEDSSDNDEYKDFSISYKITSQWENQYNMEVTIVNNGENTIENWRVGFDLEDQIQSIWNAKIESSEGDHYIIKNDGWNQDIKPNKKIKFGYSAKFKDIQHMPKYEEMNMVCLQVPEKNYSVTCSSIDGVTAKIQIKNLSNEDIEDWKMFLPNSLDIKNIWDAKIDFKDNNNFYINNAEYNSTIKANGTVEFGFNFSGSLPDNKKIQLYEMKLLNIKDFIQDSDNDGISDDLEVKDYGTSPNKSDTDGDGISDYYEIFVAHTDPLKIETKAGINDNNSDTDEDGLSLADEIKLGTNPLLYDTDEDGLSDGEEVNVYKTNPLEYDSDYDGLSDYDEIILGLDPLNKDTGNTGEIDSKKVIEQKITEEIENGRGISKVEIVLKSAGNVGQETLIDEVYDISDMSSSKALLGSPIEISMYIDLKDNALVKFYIDPSLLKKVSDPNNLALALYDEDKQTCKLLNSKLNIKDGTISVETKTFGEFCIIDKSKLSKKMIEKRSVSVPTAKNIKTISKTTLKSRLKNLVKKEQGWKMPLRTYTPEEAVDIVMKYEKQAELVGKNVGMPKEYIQAILFREITCIYIADDVADSGVMNYFLYMDQMEVYNNAKWYAKPKVPVANLPLVKDSSTGLGQIIGETAIESYNNAMDENLLSGSRNMSQTWKDRKKIWYKLKDNNSYNVQMVGYVLRWGADKKEITPTDFNKASSAKVIFARYNGTRESTKKYGKIVYNYYQLFKKYYK